MSEFNICGVLIHARATAIEKVKSSLEAIAGVEVHTATDNGRLVVTVESDDRKYVADTITGMQHIEGVLSAAMVYQFSDEITATEGEMSA